MKHVILKVDEEKYKTLKLIVKEFKEQFPNTIIGPLRRGNLGDYIIASFVIRDEKFNQIIEKLEGEGIKLFSKETKNELKEMLLQNSISSLAERSEHENIQAVAKNNTPGAVLDYAIKTGDYEKVIQLSKDYRSGFEILKKAKDSIDKTITNAVEIAYYKAIKSRYDADKSVNQLIKIASDRNLKTLHKLDLIKSAGLKAIEICSIYNEINVLIQICNNNNMPHIVCMKAALKIAYVLFSDGEKFEENIDYIIRYLNLRWLDIVSLTVSSEMTEKEKGTYKTLITAIKEESGKNA
ncbi:MAG: hypothetical protein P4L45_16955 [Ignavibacteriaceae bacterium]|nr:hypothetical protein [Ignavibacteriaceae bacterium]